MANPLLLALNLLLVGTALEAQSIKSFPLDPTTVYHLKVGSGKVTTLVFPQPLTAVEGSGVTLDPKIKAPLLLSYHGGDRFLSVRPMIEPARGVLNVILNRKVYVIELVTDPVPFQSVTFTAAAEASSQAESNHPTHLLGLLDQAKAYPLLAAQYPEMVSQIEQAEPLTRTAYHGFAVILQRVFRFEADDALVFQVEFVNETIEPIPYLPQSLAVRVGSSVYWSALADASGVIPAATVEVKTGAVTPGHSHGWFVIAGTASGRPNHLSVHNPFNLLVFRPEPRS